MQNYKLKIKNDVASAEFPALTNLPMNICFDFLFFIRRSVKMFSADLLQR